MPHHEQKYAIAGTTQMSNRVSHHEQKGAIAGTTQMPNRVPNREQADAIAGTERQTTVLIYVLRMNQPKNAKLFCYARKKFSTIWNEKMLANPRLLMWAKPRDCCSVLLHKQIDLIG